MPETYMRAWGRDLPKVQAAPRLLDQTLLDAEAAVFEGRCRGKVFEHRTGTLFEGLEPAETAITSQRTAVLVEHHDSAAANQEAPFAADAVVESCVPLKRRMPTKGSNHEFVPSSHCPVDGTGVVLPKIHELAKRQLADRPKVQEFY